MIHLPGAAMPAHWTSAKVFLDKNELSVTLAGAPGYSLLVTASVWSFWNMGLIFFLSFPPFLSAFIGKSNLE